MNQAVSQAVSTMTLENAKALIADDMRSVDRLIGKRLSSEVALINQLSAYIVNSGGKRLRPQLVLLAAGALGYQGEQHQLIAAIIEFIHTATLLHDDVVDASSLRRGQETANALWGNEAAVLVGDFLYSRAFEMMVEADNMRVMEILAHATNTIAEGEVLQLLNCNDPDTTEERYLEVIRSKTAKLFQAATQLGAIITHSSAEIERAMADYGMHLGTAFQLIDDVLDYSATSKELGKNIGDDLAEGKPTLPLIYAMNKGSSEQSHIIREAIENGSRDNMPAIADTIQSTGAITYTADCAKREADMAIQSLSALSDSPFKQALLTLAHFSVNRSF